MEENFLPPSPPLSLSLWSFSPFTSSAIPYLGPAPYASSSDRALRDTTGCPGPFSFRPTRSAVPYPTSDAYTTGHYRPGFRAQSGVEDARNSERNRQIKCRKPIKHGRLATETVGRSLLDLTEKFNGFCTRRQHKVFATDFYGFAIAKFLIAIKVHVDRCNDFLSECSIKSRYNEFIVFDKTNFDVTNSGCNNLFSRSCVDSTYVLALKIK